MLLSDLLVFSSKYSSIILIRPPLKFITSISLSPSKAANQLTILLKETSVGHIHNKVLRLLQSNGFSLLPPLHHLLLTVTGMQSIVTCNYNETELQQSFLITVMQTPLVVYKVIIPAQFNVKTLKLH